MSSQTSNIAEWYKEEIRYRRSPRLVKKIDMAQIEIENPPQKIEPPKGGIIQLIAPTLCMMLVTVAVSIFMKQSSYVLMSVSGTLVTLIVSIAKFVSDRKECKRLNKKRKVFYEEYLLKLRKEIYERKEAELVADAYNYPALDKLEAMIAGRSHRLYERNYNDKDFLHLVLGHTDTEISFPIIIQHDELSMEEDELITEAKSIREEAKMLPNKPVVIDLKNAHLGLVGEKENVHEQIKLIVSQITFFQSYHDVEIVVIYDGKYNKDFQWMRWYPHLKLNALNVSGCINSEKMRDQVLGSLTQILKERQEKLDESKKESKFLPHYIFIIDEPKLIMDHSIMEYLNKDGKALGFSIIYTSYFQADLPEYIGTVFSIDNSAEGTLLLNEKELVGKQLTLNHVGNVDLEKMARDTGILKHEQGVVSHIPESITFFEMYQVERPEDLHVRERWQKNESHKSLAVPLGVRAKDDYVSLNLHEKAHGPHGLVAGTTGSGKSEIVQSYILSLAVNFHPYEVGFLLIDYKGGGMANLFKDLPHLLGTITNLDGSESMRAMASIKSELARRQQIFSQYEVNHINAYNKLFKLGKAKEPLPHLFLISDEFAELKKEQPDFMSELISAARIGRSLGIHLILATQKPTGVVDDQIWTNSKFKLALKVQNEGDSKEIIKTPDAAFITQAGRAYLQVGNNEIYELFQSAWSGAAYSVNDEGEMVDERVYLVNDLGQGELINQDLSKQEDGNQIKATQLDVVVSHIHDMFAKENLPRVKSPWLPSLKRLIVNPYIQKERIQDRKGQEETDLTVHLGMVDIPEQQKQIEYRMDIPEDGNLSIYGSSGFGKTFTLSSIMLELALKNPASQLHFYIMDFGNSGLISFKNLPHTADYMSLDEMEKIDKFLNLMQEEIKRRKRSFAKASAMNFTMYNQVAEERLPAIILFIDNYDVIREMENDMETILTQFTRDGVGIGIYTVITATRTSAVRYTVQNNFKNKLALFMYDESDIQAVVGRPPYALGEIKGRGFVKLENVNQIQLYTVADAGNLLDYMEQVKCYVEEIDQVYTGKRPKAIPMLPDELTLNNLWTYCENASVNLIPIGLDAENVEVQYLDLNQHRQILIGTSQSGKTNLLKVLLAAIDSSVSIYLIDSKASELIACQSQENITYISCEKESIIKLGELLARVMEERKNGYEEERETNPELIPKMYYEQQPNVVVLVEEWDDFAEYMEDYETEQVQSIMTMLDQCGITLITTAASGRLRGYDPVTQYIKEAMYGVILGNPSEQSVFDVPYIRDANSDVSLGYVTAKGKLTKVKIPLM